MSFVPTPVPKSASSEQITQINNINLQLISAAIQELEDTQKEIKQKQRKQSSISGLTETLNFNGVSSGEVLTLTLSGGVIIAKTVV